MNPYRYLRTWYQELLDDANAIENDAERGEAIAALGGTEQFIANLKSQYVTPILSRYNAKHRSTPNPDSEPPSTGRYRRT